MLVTGSGAGQGDPPYRLQMLGQPGGEDLLPSRSEPWLGAMTFSHHRLNLPPGPTRRAQLSCCLKSKKYHGDPT